MAGNDYWDTSGKDFFNDLNETARIKMWTALFVEQAALEEETAKDIAERLVSHSAASDIDTQDMDALIQYLEQAKGSEGQMSQAINTFLSVMSDTFYAGHVMSVPKLRIVPEDRPVFNLILTRYLAIAWYLGACWARQHSQGG